MVGSTTHQIGALSKWAFKDMESKQLEEHRHTTREGESVLPSKLVVNPVCTSITASAEILSPSASPTSATTAREILERAVYIHARAIPPQDIEFVAPPSERGLGVMAESSTAAGSRKRYNLRPRDPGQHRWGSGRNG